MSWTQRCPNPDVGVGTTPAKGGSNVVFRPPMRGVNNYIRVKLILNRTMREDAFKCALVAPAAAGKITRMQVA